MRQFTKQLGIHEGHGAGKVKAAWNMKGTAIN